MILKVKIPNHLTLNIYNESNQKILPKKTSTNDNCFLNTFEFDNCNSFILEVLNPNKKVVNLKLFRDNWYNGIKSTLISADVTIIRQKWEVIVKDKLNSYLEINISTQNRANVLNGHDKYFVIKTERTNLSKIKYNNVSHFMKEKILLFCIMLANIIPLVLVLTVFLYCDIYHPEYFRSGPLYIIIADIPIAIVLIIYLVRYFIYLKNFKRMIT